MYGVRLTELGVFGRNRPGAKRPGAKSNRRGKSTARGIYLECGREVRFPGKSNSRRRANHELCLRLGCSSARVHQPAAHAAERALQHLLCLESAPPSAVGSCARLLSAPPSATSPSAWYASRLLCFPKSYSAVCFPSRLLCSAASLLFLCFPSLPLFLSLFLPSLSYIMLLETNCCY